jgi:4-hydroxybenzoate polyprenyltransferase
MGSLATQRVSGWRTALKLGRVSNLPTVWSNVIAATALAGGAPLRVMLLVAAAASILYVGGMFLNDAFDADIDARERPQRPIPAGEVSSGTVFIVGFALLIAGVALLASVNVQAGAVGLALAGAILIYDRYHKGNPLSPFVMGGCRALVYVAAAAAAAATASPVVILAALAIAAYVAGLTYTARLEAFNRLGSLWPLVLLAAPIVLALPQIGATAPVLLSFVALLASAFVITQLLLRRLPGDVGRAVAILIAGVAVNDALLAATSGAAYASFACLACFVLTLLLQRHVPAT